MNTSAPTRAAMAKVFIPHPPCCTSHPGPVILATGVKPNATGVILKRPGRRVNSPVLLNGDFGERETEFAVDGASENRRLGLRTEYVGQRELGSDGRHGVQE